MFKNNNNLKRGRVLIKLEIYGESRGKNLKNIDRGGVAN